jgi:hypothetical protein
VCNFSDGVGISFLCKLASSRAHFSDGVGKHFLVSSQARARALRRRGKKPWLVGVSQVVGAKNTAVPFSIDTYSTSQPASYCKIGKRVQFAPELEIPLSTISPTVANAKYLSWLGLSRNHGICCREICEIYARIYGVLYHHGKSTCSGHYTVDVLHLNGGSGTGEGWLHIDDKL